MMPWGSGSYTGSRTNIHCFTQKKQHLMYASHRRFSILHALWLVLDRQAGSLCCRRGTGRATPRAGNGCVFGNTGDNTMKLNMNIAGDDMEEDTETTELKIAVADNPTNNPVDYYVRHA